MRRFLYRLRNFCIRKLAGRSSVVLNVDVRPRGVYTRGDGALVADNHFVGHGLMVDRRFAEITNNWFEGDQ